jgi:hypothetical protein
MWLHTLYNERNIYSPTFSEENHWAINLSAMTTLSEHDNKEIYDVLILKCQLQGIPT